MFILAPNLIKCLQLHINIAVDIVTKIPLGKIKVIQTEHVRMHFQISVNHVFLAKMKRFQLDSQIPKHYFIIVHLILI